MFLGDKVDVYKVSAELLKGWPGTLSSFNLKVDLDKRSLRKGSPCGRVFMGEEWADIFAVMGTALPTSEPARLRFSGAQIQVCYKNENADLGRKIGNWLLEQGAELVTPHDHE